MEKVMWLVLGGVAFVAARTAFFGPSSGPPARLGRRSDGARARLLDRPRSSDDTA